MVQVNEFESYKNKEKHQIVKFMTLINYKSFAHIVS